MYKSYEEYILKTFEKKHFVLRIKPQTAFTLQR